MPEHYFKMLVLDLHMDVGPEKKRNLCSCLAFWGAYKLEFALIQKM